MLKYTHKVPLKVELSQTLMENMSTSYHAASFDMVILRMRSMLGPLLRCLHELFSIF